MGILSFIKKVPIIGDVIQAGANLIGQNSANKTNMEIADKATKANITSAREQMAFQKEMSNTSYQRGTADMKAAGINPMLAYAQGGASSPSGSSANAATTTVENALGPAVSTAMESRRLRKEIRGVESNIALNEQMAKTGAAQAKLNDTNAKVAEKNAEVIDAKMPALKAQAALEKGQAEIDKKMLNVDNVSRRLNEYTGTINNATSAFKPFGGGSSRGPTNRTHEYHIDKNTGEVLNEYRYNSRP